MRRSEALKDRSEHITFEPRAKKVSFDSDNMWVELTDGRQLGVPLAYFPRLLNASQAQKLDEDISVKGLCWELVTGLNLPERHHDFRALYAYLNFMFPRRSVLRECPSTCHRQPSGERKGIYSPYISVMIFRSWEACEADN